MRTLSLFVLAILVALPVAAQDLSGFEKVFLPLDPTVTVHGIQDYGAVLDAWSEENIRFWPDRNGQTGSVHPFLLAGSMEQSAVANGAGRLLYIDRTQAPRVALSLMLRSGNLQDVHAHMAHMRVVRERDFRQGRTVFSGVPFLFDDDPFSLRSTPAHRIKLHLYDLDLAGNLTARINIHSSSGGSVRQQDVALTSRNGADASFPFYAEVPIEPICVPQGTRVPCLGGAGIVEIQFAESIADPPRFVRYYAFVSMTDVKTGAVTLITP